MSETHSFFIGLGITMFWASMLAILDAIGKSIPYWLYPIGVVVGIALIVYGLYGWLKNRTRRQIDSQTHKTPTISEVLPVTEDEIRNRMISKALRYSITRGHSLSPHELRMEVIEELKAEGRLRVDDDASKSP